MGSNLPVIAPELKDLPHVPVDCLEPFQGELKTLSICEYNKLKKSLQENGIIVPFFVWKETGKLLDGHQRARVMMKEGWAFDVPVVYISAENEQDAKQKLLVITSQYGRVTQEGWDSFTFDLDDDWLLQTVNLDALPLVFGDFDTGEDEESHDVPNKQPNPRNLPIDVIYTATFPASCCLAAAAGIKYGIQSGKPVCPNCGVMKNHELIFIDNDYFNYNHEKHAEWVKAHRPKYATVRDVMTKKQCEVDGIKFYDLQQILEWAEELNQYAKNIIVIPKYNCLDQIPDKYMLGYSVPTSHGGTPLPPEAFRGRRVHLLGGSWKAQLNYMSVLQDDVVSIDNNYQGNIAQMGGCVLPNGTRKDLSAYGIDTRTNPAYIALAISLGNMAEKINELYRPPDGSAGEFGFSLVVADTNYKKRGKNDYINQQIAIFFITIFTTIRPNGSGSGFVVVCGRANAC